VVELSHLREGWRNMVRFKKKHTGQLLWRLSLASRRSQRAISYWI